MDVKQLITATSLLCASALLPATALAQLGQDPVPVAEDIETIEIVADKTAAWTKGDFKKEVFKLEKQFYALYNTLTDDPMLKVQCRKKAKEGTRSIKVQVCEPAYKTRVHVNLLSLKDAGSLHFKVVRNEKMKRYSKQQMEHVNKLMMSNQALRGKLEKYVSLNEEYQEILSAAKDDD